MTLIDAGETIRSDWAEACKQRVSHCLALNIHKASNKANKASTQLAIDPADLFSTQLCVLVLWGICTCRKARCLILKRRCSVLCRDGGSEPLPRSPLQDNRAEQQQALVTMSDLTCADYMSHLCVLFLRSFGICNQNPCLTLERHYSMLCRQRSRAG